MNFAEGRHSSSCSVRRTCANCPPSSANQRASPSATFFSFESGGTRAGWESAAECVKYQPEVKIYENVRNQVFCDHMRDVECLPGYPDSPVYNGASDRHHWGQNRVAFMRGVARSCSLPCNIPGTRANDSPGSKK